MAKTPLGRLPRDAIRMLEAARKIDAGDTKGKADIESGASVAELVTRQYK